MVFGRYASLARWLKWLTLSLFAYMLTAFLARPDWVHVMVASLLPSVRWQSSYWSALVGTLGTTISPYLFFWQASQEVEELEAGRHAPRRAAGADDPLLRNARVDVTSGMILSNLVMYFIIVATASTLHPAGVREIETARQAAEALRPLAGSGAYVLYALGIIGTGLLAIPVLAGSGAYAVAELLGWCIGLDLPLRRARPFYALLTGGVLAGIGLDLFGLNAVRALFWSAVVNGVLAPPLLVLVLMVGNSPRIMGRHVNGIGLNALGWLSVAVMTAAALALFVSL